MKNIFRIRADVKNTYSHRIRALLDAFKLSIDDDILRIVL